MHCRFASESPEHLALKALVAELARSAGWEAELEAGAEDGAYRADVLTTAGDRRIAWEIQRSGLTEAEAIERTLRHVEAGNEIVWLMLNDQSWADRVPSVIVRSVDVNADVRGNVLELDHGRPLQDEHSRDDALWDRDLGEFASHLATQYARRGSRRPDINAWIELPDLLGFDTVGVLEWIQRPGASFDPIALDQWSARIRWRRRRARLAGFLTSVLAGTASCLSIIEPMRLAGPGKRPDFAWVTRSDLDEAARLLAHASGWTVYDVEPEPCRCGQTVDTYIGGALAHLEPLPICWQCHPLSWSTLVV